MKIYFNLYNRNHTNEEGGRELQLILRVFTTLCPGKNVSFATDVSSHVNFFLKIWLEKGSWHLSQCLFVHLFRLHPILWFIDIVWVSPSLYSKSNCTVKLYKRTKFRPSRPNQLHFLVFIYQFSNLLKFRAYYWYLNRKLPKK